MKSNFVGKDIIYYATDNDFRIDQYYQSEIKRHWKCIDVPIATGKYYCEYCDDENIKTNDQNFLALKIQDVNNPQIIRNLNIGCLKSSDNLKLSDKVFNWATRSSESHGFTFKEVFENEMKSRRNEALMKEKKSNQELAKRKQELTAKYGAANADKIIAGKFEMGMSKSVCKEIAGYAIVVEKTPTSETWKVSNIFWGTTTYLFFEGDKLVRIVKR